MAIGTPGSLPDAFLNNWNWASDQKYLPRFNAELQVPLGKFIPPVCEVGLSIFVTSAKSFTIHVWAAQRQIQALFTTGVVTGGSAARGFAGEEGASFDFPRKAKVCRRANNVQGYVRQEGITLNACCCKRWEEKAIFNLQAKSKGHRKQQKVRTVESPTQHGCNLNCLNSVR